MDFRCIDDCSQCCIEREYYPSIEFGKIGVLILPDEKEKIESFAKNHRINIKILPRIGISAKSEGGPTKIVAYQLMGKDTDGNTCPFLDTDSQNCSPHGGHMCKIYENRPLACSAYPLIESKPILLDDKCKFCKEYGDHATRLDSEIISLEKIKSKLPTRFSHVWRFATGVGNLDDKSKIHFGWILQ